MIAIDAASSVRARSVSLSAIARDEAENGLLARFMVKEISAPINFL